MKTEKEIVQLLLRSRLFHEFSAAELLEILPQLSPKFKWVDRGEILVWTDEPARQVGMVISGLLTLCRLEDSGQARDLNWYAADEVFGLQAFFSENGKTPMAVQAAANTEILLFDICSLLKNGRYKDRLKNAALLILADQSMHDILRIEMLLSSTMRERIMIYFKTMGDKCQSNTVQIKASQAELADYLGVNRSALSRELNKMQREGILEILPNRRYHIMKWKPDLPEIRQCGLETSKVNIGERKLC